MADQRHKPSRSAPSHATRRRVRRALLVALPFAAWLFPLTARAQPAGSSELEMTRVMEDYFAGEQTQAWAILGAGVTSLGAGSYLLVRDDARARAASYPILVCGLLEAIIGTSVLLGTDRQVSERRARIARDPSGFKADERARMHGVLQRFDIFQVTEVVLLSAGIGLATWGAIDERPTMEGLGVGLAVSSAIALGIDHVAAGRGQRYLERIDGFEPSVSAQGVALEWKTSF